MISRTSPVGDETYTVLSSSGKRNAGLIQLERASRVALDALRWRLGLARDPRARMATRRQGPARAGRARLRRRRHEPRRTDRGSQGGRAVPLSTRRTGFRRSRRDRPIPAARPLRRLRRGPRWQPQRSLSASPSATASGRAGGALCIHHIFGRRSALTGVLVVEMRTVFRVRGIAPALVVATIAPYLVACHGVQNAPAADPGSRRSAPALGPPEHRVLDRRPTRPPRRRRGRSRQPRRALQRKSLRVTSATKRGPTSMRTRREDVAFLVVQETGGSGTFFYAVAALDLVARLRRLARCVARRSHCAADDRAPEPTASS